MAGPINYIEYGEGLHAAVRAAGYRIWNQSGQAMADNPQAVQAIIDAYDPMPWLRARKLDALKDAVREKVDLFGLMDGGSATNITATQFATFWATATNNYRSLKAQIAAAPDQATLAAISLGAGWPANP
jgi:hypothetical protein